MTRDQKKEVERLYENEGMSYGGIARILGLPKSTVSSHIMRAKTKSSKAEIKIPFFLIELKYCQEGFCLLLRHLKDFI